MRRILALALFTTALAAQPPAAVAQEGYYVYREHVKPSMTTEYEAVTSEMLDAMAAAGIDDIEFATISGPEIGYVFAIPVDGVQGVADFFTGWETSMSKIDADRMASLEARSSKAVEYAETSLIVLRPDLSYLPESTQISADQPFRKYHWVYVTAGMESVFEEVARDYVAMWSENELDYGWRIYQAVMGPELPMFLVVENATSEAEYVGITAEIQKKMASQTQKLGEKMQQATRKLEINEGWVRPELSYPPMATEGGQ
jgi:hypothetical protein